jgi:hypothetical protein
MQAIAQSVIGRTIAAPRALEQLLLEADRDLGCAADACMIVPSEAPALAPIHA